MKQNNEIRTVIRSAEFDEYYNSLPDKVSDKYDYVLHIIVTQYVVSEKFVKSIENTDFYELRISLGNNEYRTMLIAIDKDSFIECTQVLLLNSFLKKDKKQYRAEIKKANEILKKYEL